MSLHSRYSGPDEVRYLFIDGGYLTATTKRYTDLLYPGEQPTINYGQISSGYTKTFYYDCLPGQQKDETDDAYQIRLSSKHRLFRSLRALRGWHVYEGVVKRTGKRARQKEVDILIAVDILTHAHRKNMHHATFIAGDQDFRPLVEAVVREGLFVELQYDPTSASVELLEAADARSPISPYVFATWCDAEFQQRHPLPVHTQFSGAPSFPGGALQVGESEDGTFLGLYKQDNGYFIVQQKPNTNGSFLGMTHLDLAYLKSVYDETYGRVTWREA